MVCRAACFEGNQIGTGPGCAEGHPEGRKVREVKCVHRSLGEGNLPCRDGRTINKCEGPKFMKYCISACESSVAGKVEITGGAWLRSWSLGMMGSLGGERHGLEVSSLEASTLSARCFREHQQTRAQSLVWHLHEVEPNPIRSEWSLLPGKGILRPAGGLTC